MKKSIVMPVLCLGLMASQANATLSELTDLNKLTWQSRIIVANNPNNSQQLIKVFNDENIGVIDRDVVWFVINDDGSIKTNYSGLVTSGLSESVVRKYQLKDNEIILIGKDGGLKERISGLDLERLFSDIDRVPMRISEMQTK